MYEIRILNGSTEEILHDTDPDSARRLLTASFTEIAASICRPTAQFSVTPHNPAYSSLHEMRTLIRIKNILTNDMEFEGRIIQKPRDSFGSDGKIIKEYSAEGLISWLMDSRQLYRSVTETPTQFLTYVLGVHNARYPDKAIQLGVCDVTGSLPCETNYRSTLEEISTNLLKRLGGEINVRRDGNGILRLDYLQNGIGTTKDVTVQVGRNLKSLSVSNDPTKIVNRLIPLGKKQENGSRLTLLGYYQDEPGRMWVEDSSSASAYTPIEGTATFDDIETQSELETAALAALASTHDTKESYRADVLDLSTIGEEAYALRAGNSYQFVCAPCGISSVLRLTKRTVNIFKPYAPTVEIGDPPERLTYTAAKTKTETEKVAQIVEEKLADIDYVTKEEYDAYVDSMEEYAEALEVWREHDTSDPPEDIPLPDTMEDLKQWKSDTDSYLTGLASWQQTVNVAIATISALTARVAALESTAVTSADIRTIEAVDEMPASPVATTLYIKDGDTS